MSRLTAGWDILSRAAAPVTVPATMVARKASS